MAAGKRSAAVATDFDSIIQGDRQRRKHEALAKEIFGKGKRVGAQGPGPKPKPGAGLSLADRITGAKRSSSATLNPTTFKSGLGKKAAKRSILPAGNVDAEWTHDLHNANSEAAYSKNQRGGAPSRLPSLDNGAALLRQQQEIIKAGNLKSPGGMIIRGLAGPYTIIAENFAPGTTADDISSAMAPIGGNIQKCFVNNSSPVTAEITFETKDGADNVISVFHGQVADGLVLALYHKIAAAPVVKPQPAATPTGPRNDNRSAAIRYGQADRYEPSRNQSREARGYNNREDITDGYYGFGKGMEVDDNSRDSVPSRGLYSDNLGSRGGPRHDRGDKRDTRDRGRGYR